MRRSIRQIALVIGTMGALFAQPQAARPADATADIRAIAASSQCIRHSWPEGRGKAPPSYIEGVTLVFARALCHQDRPEVAVVAAPADERSPRTDGLAYYQSKNKVPAVQQGPDAIRQTYLLLLGLGMMESSGRYCEGRDVSQCFSTADNSEAGLFQTSYGVRGASAELTKLFELYQRNGRPCLLDDFKGRISCRIHASANPRCPNATSDVAGVGPGADWQRLTKACPAFATEYAAIVLRKSGGSRGEFNPIRKLQAEPAPACDTMLRQVQDYVAHHAEACSAL